jgi:hypothetical protein
MLSLAQVNKATALKRWSESKMPNFLAVCFLKTWEDKIKQLTPKRDCGRAMLVYNSDSEEEFTLNESNIECTWFTRSTDMFEEWHVTEGKYKVPHKNHISPSLCYVWAALSMVCFPAKWHECWVRCTLCTNQPTSIILLTQQPPLMYQTTKLLPSYVSVSWGDCVSVCMYLQWL